MKNERGMTFVSLLIVLAIIAVLAIALLSRRTSGPVDEGAPLGQRGFEAEAKACLWQIRTLASGHYMATGSFPTMDELATSGWKEPSGGAYYYESAPPRYMAIPVPGGPADGLRVLTLALTSDGGATIE
jgi:competence protein ComGC